MTKEKSVWERILEAPEPLTDQEAVTMLQEESYFKGIKAERLRTKKEIDLLIARSVFEILPAKQFINTRERANYYLGVRETEKVWHELLEDLKKRLEIEPEKEVD